MLARQFCQILVVVSALALPPTAASADDNAISRLPPLTVRAFTSGSSTEKVVVRALDPIRTHDLDGNGLDDADIDTMKAILAAAERAAVVGRLLRFDLNGDLKITETEVRMVPGIGGNGTNSDSKASEIDAKVQYIMRPDRNRDGAISLEEMLAAGDVTVPAQESVFDELRALVQADPSGNGHITVLEMESLVRAAFAAVDRNGDGVLDASEHAAFKTAIEQRDWAASSARCIPPKALAGEELLLVNINEGSVQPSVTVNGQGGLTSLARIVIEPGEAPLYIILLSRDVVWKLEGETDRLKHVVAISPPTAQGTTSSGEPWAHTGIVGIGHDVVTFLPTNSCGQPYPAENSPEAKAMALRIAGATASEIVRTIDVEAAEGVALPSGTVMNPLMERRLLVKGDGTYLVIDGGAPKRIDRPWAPEFKEEWLAKPGGVVDLDPASVIAPGKVEAYQVLPRQDGLRRLVENGTLERTDRGYRLLKPLPRWPAGLSGPHAVTFFVPKGMTLPSGDPDISNVVMEP